MLDIDWARTEGTVRYPFCMNRTLIHRVGLRVALTLKEDE